MGARTLTEPLPTHTGLSRTGCSERVSGNQPSYFGGLRSERFQRMCDRLVTTELLRRVGAVAIERTLDRLWANRAEVHGHDGVVGIDLEVPGEDSAKPAPGMGTDDHH